MASPSTPTHGKLINLYALRPNGFKGSGLNDLTWGAFSGAAASGHFEVVVTTGGATSPNVFKWRVNGGAWTLSVNMTGASQNLVAAGVGTQAITFAAIVGHTVDDQWSLGNLYAEGCDESTTTAQITNSTHRLLNPNYPPTWTDIGGKQVLEVDFSRGYANFSGNVGTVTVAGSNAYVLESGLQKIGYLQGVNLNMSRGMSDASYNGVAYQSFLPGQLSGSGSINKLTIADKDLFDLVINSQKYFLVQMFNYDPDQDQTGDHWNLWISFESLGVNSPVADAVKTNLSFKCSGPFSFVSNT